MTTTDSPTVENDFYAQLMAEIEAGKIEQAVKMIMALQERDSQMEILSRLVGAIDHALDIRGASTLDLDRARALVRTRDRAHELAVTLDLEHAQALELAIDRARVLYLYLERAEQINRTIVGCLTEMMAKDNPSGVDTAQHSTAGDKGNWRRVAMLALLCTVLLLVLLTLMVIQSKAKIDAAATATSLASQQTYVTATDSTPNK